MTTAVEPNQIDALPGGPSTNDPDNFDDEADAFVAALPVMIGQQNEANATTYQNALAAHESAEAAAVSAGTADERADDALVQRNAAEGFKNAAQGFRNEAEGFKDAAAASAAALVATSASNRTIGAGSVTFTTQAGKYFNIGQTIKVVPTADGARFMVGRVTAYSGTSLTLDVTNVSVGAGAYASWSLFVSGENGGPGPAGSVAGGSLAGALWTAKGVDVASAATIDPWSAGGELVPLIGVAAITTVAAAPQAGAFVTLLATGVCTITASANLIIKGLTIGQVYTCAAGDEIDLRAETTTLFRVSVRRADGAAMMNHLGALHNLRHFSQSGTFTATKTGWHKVTTIGGGGSGAAASVVGNSKAAASGGGAGGFASGMRFLVAGQTYPVIVGAGGTADLTYATDQGRAGGSTSFSGSGVATMTANGGAGGVAAVGLNGTWPGGAGGTSAGGDINVIGGSGGACEISTTINANVAGGGGAVGIKGKTCNGGGAFVYASSGRAAGGGAGVGGDGGSATRSASGAAYGAGGGTAGAAAAIATGVAAQSQAGINYQGEAGATANSEYGTGDMFYPNHLEGALAGGMFYGSATNWKGSGGCGYTGYASQMAAGMFAGGGANAATSSGQDGAGAGGRFGGGGGGCSKVAVDANTYLVQGGAGGAGGVWIEF
jgi:hypothetical protein